LSSENYSKGLGNDIWEDGHVNMEFVALKHGYDGYVRFMNTLLWDTGWYGVRALRFGVA